VRSGRDGGRGGGGGGGGNDTEVQHRNDYFGKSQKSSVQSPNTPLKIRKILLFSLQVTKTTM
jgi:hypothetical protein